MKEPRALALELCRAALDAVEPGAAVRAHLRREGTQLHVGATSYALEEIGRVRLVGAGKASPGMAVAVEEILGERLESGLCIAKAGQLCAPLPRHALLREGGHPLPDQAGRAASEDLLELLDGLEERDLLLVLLSGGASSLLALPAPGLELDDLRQTTEQLLGCGARIEEVNAVRKHLSAITGGRLAARAFPAQLLALVLSDVVGSPLEAIASGPCAADPTTFDDALAVARRYDLALPPRVQAVLEAGARGAREETLKPGDPRLSRVHHQLCGSNELAARAACRHAEAAGLRVELLTTTLQGEAITVGRELGARLRRLVADRQPFAPPACLVLGGETTVRLEGRAGRGGRNQELALAAALELEGLPASALLVALATDGNDGPTDAAGAMVDGGTVARGLAAGLDACRHLAAHDAYPFLEASGDLLRLGPTGTNVNDLCFLIAR